MKRFYRYWIFLFAFNEDNAMTIISGLILKKRIIRSADFFITGNKIKAINN